MVIDFHTHVFAPDIKHDRSPYLAADQNFAELYASKKSAVATADELIDALDRAGIARAVIVNIDWASHELCRRTNDYIMQSVARYPDRLVGFGTVSPQAGEAALAELDCLADGGIRGIGEIRPDANWLDPTATPVIEPLLDKLRAYRMILLLHTSEPVGHNYPGKGDIIPSCLYPFLIRYPAVNIVCAHWGGGLPFYFLMPEVRRALPHVYFDTAASPLLYESRIYQQVIQLVGSDRILFGSDWPLLGPERSLAEVNALDIDEATRHQILEGNAIRLLEPPAPAGD